MRKSLLPLLWALLLIPGARLLAAPTPAEIAAALDDPDGVWSFDGASAEVVPFEGAVGGTALKLEVGRLDSLSLSRAAPGARMMGRLRFWVETTQLKVHAIQGYLPVGDANLSKWTQAPYLPSDYNGAFQYALHSESEYDADPRVIYLDAFEAEPGILVEPECWGCEVEIVPAREFYDPAEYVTLIATPDAEHDRFLYWDGGESLSYDASKIVQAEYAGNHRAVAATSTSLDGIEVIVSAASGTSFPASGVIRIEPLPGRSNPTARFRSPGAGFVRFKAKATATENAAAATYIGNKTLIPGTPLEIEFWTSQVGTEVELSFDGALELQDMAFEAGAPVDVAVFGEGSVTGAPGGGRATVGQTLSLTAQPAPGWNFGGWRGARESDATTLYVKADDAVSIEAWFYEERALLGFQIGVLGGDDWTEEPEGDSYSVAAPDPAEAFWEGALLWTLDGPGEFSFDYENGGGHARVSLDRKETVVLSQTDESFPRRSIAIQVPPGRHELAITVSNPSDDTKSLEARLLNVDWKPGYLIRINAQAGGSVAGAPELGARVPAGTNLNLKATPNPGSTFAHWTGPNGSNSPDLTLAVWEDIDMQAAFVTAAEPGTWVSALTGARRWTREGSVWKSPTDSLPEESARMETTVTGPCKLTFDLAISGEPGNGLVWGLNGNRLGVWMAGPQEISLGAGEHVFHVEHFRTRSEAGHFLTISNFQIRYKVSLDAPFAEIDSPGLAIEGHDPNTGRDSTVWSGFALAGSQLPYSATTDRGMTFARWTGDLEGQGSSGVIEVNRPIAAKAIFHVPEYLSPIGPWTVDKPERAYLAKLGPGIGLRDASALTLTRSVAGPASLLISKRGLSSLVTRIDGEVVQPVFSSLPFDRIFVPVGSHEVTLALEADPAFSNLSPYIIISGITSIERQEGYPISTTPSAGGEVTTNAVQGSIPAGGSLTAAATASAGWEFVAWAAPFEAQPASFAIVPEGPVFLHARFRPTDRVGDLDWSYSDWRPAGYESGSSPGSGQDPRFPLGYLRYQFDGAEPKFQTAYASTTVEGPGELSAVGEPQIWAGGLLVEFVVDGIAYSRAEAARGLQIGNGAHSVSWRLTAQDGAPLAGQLKAGLPFVRTSFEVAPTAWNATVAVEPLKDSYLHGEIVTTTAPPTNAGGAAFAGWWEAKAPGSPAQIPEGRFLGDENIRTFAVVSQKPLHAAYGTVLSSSDSVVVLSLGASSWRLSETPGHDGGPSLESGYESGYLAIAAKEDVYLSFYVRSEGESMIVFADSPSFHTVFSGSMDWTRVSVALRKGETLAIYGRTDLGKCYLSGIETTPGWGPSLLRSPHGAVVAEPSDFADLLEGEPVTLRPSVADSGSFVGWIRADGTFDASPARVIGVGSTELVRPVFAGTVETAIGPAEADFPDRWISDIDGRSLASDLRGLSVPRNELRFSIEGPVVITANRGTSIEGLVDGSAIAWRDVDTWYSSDSYIQIPPGVHALALRHNPAADDAASLADLALAPGFAVSTPDVAGGHVAVAPEKRVFAPGESATFLALPYPGWAFVKWQAPFASEPARFSRIVDRDLAPTPVFEPKQVAFEARGREWRGYGVSSITESAADLIGDGSRFAIETGVVGGPEPDAWIETDVVGPAVLIAAEHANHWTIDGSSILGHRFVSEAIEEGTVAVGLPIGDSALRLALPGGYVSILAPPTRIEEGCLIVARGAGLTVRLSPRLAVYPMGTQVSIEVLDPITATEIDWIGLPEGATVEGRKATFAVEDHAHVEALRWEDVRVFGLSARHAGNNDWQPHQTQSGQLQLIGLRNREADYLSLRLPGWARLRYDFGLNGHSSTPTTVTIGRNGNGPPVELIDEHHFFGVIDARAPNEEIRFRLATTGSSLDEEGVALRSLEILDYLDWWLTYDPSSVPPYQETDPAADPDLDGLLNYVEYLLDSNPLAPETSLQIAATHPPHRLELQRRRARDGFDELFAITFSLRLEGPWEDAEPILRNEEIDAENLSWVRRALSVEPIPDVPMFFRLEYSGDLPSLDELLGE